MEKDKLKLDFVGIGVNKSATTWMYKCLHLHPEICVSKIKETNFFGMNHWRGEKWFVSQFDNFQEGNSIRGEYSPAYFGDREAAERIKKHAPDVKLIVCLRNPIDRFMSGYNFDIVTGRSCERSINKTIKKGIKNQSKQVQNHLEASLYCEKLKFYTNLFSKKSILVILYDDVLNDPNNVMKKLYTFLNVDSSYVPEIVKKKINVTASNKVHLLFVTRFINNIRSKLKQSGLKNIVTPFARLIGVTFAVKKILQINSNNSDVVLKEYKKESLDQDSQKELINFFQIDIRCLEKFIGRDLSAWK